MNNRGGGADASATEERLLNSLLSNYNNLIRPVKNVNDAINVSISLTLYQLRGLKANDEQLRLEAWMNIYWTDHKLKWNPDDYEGLKRIHIPIEQLWRPDISLYNNLQEDKSEFGVLTPTLSTIWHNGTVWWASPSTFLTSCQFNVDFYPFDTQNCSLFFATWSHNGNEVFLADLYGYALLDKFLPNGQWDLLEMPAVSAVDYYPCCPEPYPYVKYNIIMKRKPLFYIYNLILPAVLLVFIGLSVFFLPAGSGQKVGLAITVLLGMTVFMLVIMDSIPPTSDQIPLIGQFFGMVNFLLSLCTVLSVAVEKVAESGDEMQRCERPPKWLRTIAFTSAKLLCMTGLYKKATQIELDNQQNSPGKENLLLDQTSPTAVDQLTYKNMVNGFGDNSPSCNSTGDENDKVSIFFMRQMCSHLQALLDISQRKTVLKDEENRNETEWKLVAKSLDRLFLVLLTVSFVLCCIFIFSRLP